MSSSPSLETDKREAREPSEAFQSAKALTVPVSPARLAWGRFDHDRNRDVGEGDIHASYSADTIASSGKIRRAFRWQAHLMVTVSLSGSDGIEQAKAYRLTPLKAFTGEATTYTQKTGTIESADEARCDPNGFYHGMTVTLGAQTFVLVGPPVVFVAKPARPEDTPIIEGEQLSLF